jgi:micrococcal nuclease
MPEFLSRWVEWFRAKPTETRALIIIIALVVAVIASPLLKWVTAAALAFVLVVVVVQVASRASVRRWAIALVALLVAWVVFSTLASAIYAPFGGGAPQEVQRAEEPTVLPPREPTQLEEPTVAQESTTQPEPTTQHPVRVKITRVVDGDTVEISPSVDGKDTVRLIGIDAPERKKPGCGAQPLAQAATAQVTTWEGSKVELEFDEDRTDRYGRLLAYVTDEMFGDIIMLNEDLLLGGYAQLYIVPPNTKYEDRLREAQEQAKKNSTKKDPIFDRRSIWTLDSARQDQLAEHGNGIGKGEGVCPSEPQPQNTTLTTASSSASPNPSPNPDPSPNRNLDVPSPNAAPGTSPSTASPTAGGGDIDCDQVGGPVAVPPGDPNNLDADGDGIGCEPPPD